MWLHSPRHHISLASIGHESIKPIMEHHKLLIIIKRHNPLTDNIGTGLRIQHQHIIVQLLDLIMLVGFLQKYLSFGIDGK